MNLTAALTTAAPWLGFFAFLTVVARAAGRHTVAEANRAAVIAWCRVIGREDPPPAPPPAQPRQPRRRAQ